MLQEVARANGFWDGKDGYEAGTDDKDHRQACPAVPVQAQNHTCRLSTIVPALAEARITSLLLRSCPPACGPMKSGC